MTAPTLPRGTMCEADRCGNSDRPLAHHSDCGGRGLAVKATQVQRFWAKVEKTDTCWLWTGSDNGRGYGHLVIDGRDHYAHRLAYELTVGPIPAGLELDHLCRVRNCVNPEHLEPVTPAENVRRAAATITACPAGHPYDEQNTYVTPGGVRQCRTCHSDRVRTERAANPKPPKALICARCGCTFYRPQGQRGPDPTRCPPCHTEARRERDRLAWQMKHANPAEAVRRGFTIQRRSA